MKKHSRKMMMIPENEYYALINMLKGGRGNYLEYEKAILDAEIQNNLADVNTDPDIRAKRHSWLYKRRKQLKDIIENRPHKVIIENPQAIPNIPPYMGIQKKES